MASPRQQPDVPGAELGFGGPVSRDPSSQCSRWNASGGRILSGEALADEVGPVVGGSKILLACMKELIRDLLACIEFGIIGRVRESAVFHQ